MGAVMFPSSDATDTSIGFVPQQDILPSTLTVHEALLFAARLRLPEYIPDSEKLARVDDVVEKLGLTTVRDVRIGDGEKRGISGGEMRRVSIGLELVAKPQILILDEPTSGLDSVSAAKVAGVLHELAHDPKERRVVIATIHQPRSVQSVKVLGITNSLSFTALSYTIALTRSPCYRTVAPYILEQEALLRLPGFLLWVSRTMKDIMLQTTCWMSQVILQYHSSSRNSLSE